MRIHKRILVVRPDRIGDVVLSTPVYHTLKQSFPDVFVGALVSPATSPLLQGNPFIDTILTDDPRDEKCGESNFFMKVREIRSHKFDTALLLMPTKRLAYMLFLAGIPYRVGVGHILYEVLTFMRGVSRRKYNPLRHESEYMLDLARRIGAREIWKKPEIFLGREEIRSARGYLERKGFAPEDRIIGVHPGSGRSAPNWSVERYAEFVAGLAREGAKVLLTGDRGEKIMEGILNPVGMPNVKTAFGELSLRELAAVISQMDLLVSSSTGPMHIAAALEIPTLSLFCPLTACSPLLWGPVGNASTVVSPDESFCRTKCPGNPHVCTFGSADEGITVKMLLENEKQSVHRRHLEPERKSS